jgi:hypothetical protein
VTDASTGFVVEEAPVPSDEGAINSDGPDLGRAGGGGGVGGGGGGASELGRGAGEGTTAPTGAAPALEIATPAIAATAVEGALEESPLVAATPRRPPLWVAAGYWWWCRSGDRGGRPDGTLPDGTIPDDGRAEVFAATGSGALAASAGDTRPFSLTAAGVALDAGGAAREGGSGGSGAADEEEEEEAPAAALRRRGLGERLGKLPAAEEEECPAPGAGEMRSPLLLLWWLAA